MFKLQSLFLRALLALSIAVGAPAALAGPIYRVSLDTAALAGGTGYLDLGFNGLSTPNPAFARASNFSGDFLDEVILAGDVSGSAASGVVLGNRTGFNFFDQAVRFGGLFSFDVSFEVEQELIGTLFSVALFDNAFNYLGADADLLTIDVLAGAPAAIVVNAPDIATVAAVPEPHEWLLLATGLVLLAATRRMQQRR